VEGAAGLPVFSPHGPGGIAQLLGPTGGYLLSYPFAAALASLLYRRGRRSFLAALTATGLSSIVILTAGAIWLGLLTHLKFSVVFAQSVAPFLPGDALKILAATIPATGFFKVAPPRFIRKDFVTTTPISLPPDAPAKGLSKSSSAVREIAIAHSPDSDDAFMFYGLATGKIRVPGYKFTHTLCDIETLNHKAMNEAFYDVTAISFHAYPYVQKDYALMACGGSVGENYGPMIVASQRIAASDIGRVRVAVPGTLTTAYLTLKLFAPEIETVTVPFDKIIPEVVAGNFDAGLIIHEGQLTYAASGLHKVIDLGQWWREQTGLPLPLGGNAIRRSLGEEVMVTVTQALRDSIQHALDFREAALEYSMQFARDLDPQLANRFVSMYVNQRTLNYGDDGKEAIRKLLTMGYERGIISTPVQVDFVG
jgi:1,4-dihydroxy-6-naphthoate synthase